MAFSRLPFFLLMLHTTTFAAPPLPKLPETSNICTKIILKTTNDFFGRPTSAEWVVVQKDGLTIAEFLRTNRGWNDIRKMWQQRVTHPEYSTILDLKNLKGKKVLDAGTGDGQFVEELRNDVAITGLDIKLRDWQVGTDRYVEADIQDTKLPRGSYDLIVNSHNVFHYDFRHSDPQIYARTLKEEARLLPKGGKAIFIRALYGTDEIWESKDFKVLYPPKRVGHSHEYMVIQKK